MCFVLTTREAVQAVFRVKPTVKQPLHVPCDAMDHVDEAEVGAIRNLDVNACTLLPSPSRGKSGSSSTIAALPSQFQPRRDL